MVLRAGSAVPRRTGAADRVDTGREHVGVLGVYGGRGALFTEGLYRPHLVPNRSDRHYLWVGRFSGVALTLLGVLYAMFLIQSVLYTFLLTETLATYVGISVLGGIVWPRANRWGALASLLSALSTNFLLYYLAGQRLDQWDPNVFARRAQRWNRGACRLQPADGT